MKVFASLLVAGSLFLSGVMAEPDKQFECDDKTDGAACTYTDPSGQMIDGTCQANNDKNSPT